ncbi:MAG: class I SAM-dependent methyltransferase [Lachnospiraceae bacterium]|nr:class I SAM-dependent methyltransferase [Lachnospiraceae bacterium]
MIKIDKKRCRICNSGDIRKIYEGQIRNGALGHYTSEAVSMYQCHSCNVIWHEKLRDAYIEKYYESKEYREAMGEESSVDEFYSIHDKDNLEKIQYTGTTLFRNKIVADVGCGGGSFLDLINGIAKEIVAVEPSKAYRDAMSDNKGYKTFAYMDDALSGGYSSKIDVLTSFDVIEHVDDPREFLNQVYSLLEQGGKAIIGTPTDAPIMRSLLGEVFEKQQLFSVQHLWILSEKSLRQMAENAGFSAIDFKYYQRYSIGNLLGWLRDKKPRSEITDSIFDGVLDSVWRQEVQNRGLADYIVAYLTK